MYISHELKNKKPVSTVYMSNIFPFISTFCADDAQIVCATSFASSAFHSLLIVVHCVGNTLLKLVKGYLSLNNGSVEGQKKKS